jgi:hypothetical protein
MENQFHGKSHAPTAKVDPTAETENVIFNLCPDGFRVSLTRHFQDSFFYDVLTFIATHLDIHYQFL